MDIMREDIFRKELKKGISGGFLFFGEEDYLKSFCLRSVREAICSDPTFAVFNEINIDALDYSPAALANALMPPPMMAEQKLVVLSGLAISEMKQSELDELCDTLSMLDGYDYNVLVLSVPAGLIDEGTQKKPSATLTALAKHLTPVRFDAITPARLSAWVEKHFNHHGVTASPALANMLIERCGRSMFTLSQETEKIAYYVLASGRTAVTADDIKNVSASVLDSDAYAFTNALLDGRTADAIDALNVMKFRRVEPVIILSEVSRVVCDLLSVKLLQKQGEPFSEIVRLLKNEYRAKLYAASASQKSEERLRRAVLLCCEADLSVKLSQGYAAIERLVCCI